MKWIKVADGFISECDVYQIVRMRYDDLTVYHCYRLTGGRSKFIGGCTTPELAQKHCENNLARNP